MRRNEQGYININDYNVNSWDILGHEDIDVIIRITFILAISILELGNSLLKINEKIISFIQLLGITVLINFGFYEMSFLLPIVIFKVIKNKTNIFTSILINMITMACFYREKDMTHSKPIDVS